MPKTKTEMINEELEKEGDPDDIGLSKVEQNLILPRMEKHVIQNSVCRKSKEAFDQCLESKGVLLSPFCIMEKFEFFHCTTRGPNLEDAKEDIREEYITLRSQYRRTKDQEALKKIKDMVFSCPDFFTL